MDFNPHLLINGDEGFFLYIFFALRLIFFNFALP